MVFWWIGTILADTLICIPIEHNWNPTIPAHCGNKQLLAIIPPIPWIVTDLVILLMPLPMVWKLHLPRLQRVGLVGLFLLGGLCVPDSPTKSSQELLIGLEIVHSYLAASVTALFSSSTMM
jgi:hypothetical protein